VFVVGRWRLAALKHATAHSKVFGEERGVYQGSTASVRFPMASPAALAVKTAKTNAMPGRPATRFANIPPSARFETIQLARF
jgi:hypothetical protein